MVNNPNSTEDLGYAFVQATAAKAGAIWRRQSEKDVGVDGILEFERRDGASAYVAVQVKSGLSYFRRSRGSFAKLCLKEKLRRLSSLTIPAIIVLFNPEDETSCWESIQDYVAERPDSLADGTIQVRLGRAFDARAIHDLKQQARTVLTPLLSRGEVIEFLRLNRKMSFGAVVQLANSVLNKVAFRVPTASPATDLLLSEDLAAIIEDAGFATPYWGPTAKGERYVQFLLGDRYVMAGLMAGPIGDFKAGDLEKTLYAFYHLEYHLEAAGKPRLREPLPYRKTTAEPERSTGRKPRHGARLRRHDLVEAASEALAQDASLPVRAPREENVLGRVAEDGLAQLMRKVKALDGERLEGHGGG